MHAGLKVSAQFVFAPPPSSHADAATIFENEHATLQRVVVRADEWRGDTRDTDAVSLSADEDSDISDIALIYVTLKSDQPLTPDNPPGLQHYPNTSLDVVFENDRLRVQRAKIEPGVFEGVHGHPGNQVFVHIKGGTWSAIEDGVPTGPEIVRKPGESGWMGEVDKHEYGNVGDTTIDLVWITLK